MTATSHIRYYAWRAMIVVMRCRVVRRYRKTSACVFQLHSGAGSPTKRMLIPNELLFDTFTAAKAYLVAQTDRDLRAARVRLQKAQGEAGNAVGLKEAQ